jgi:hypothetical protein
LPVIEDVFRRADHFELLQSCQRLFYRENYKLALPIALIKLDQFFKGEKYLACLSLIPYINKYGDKDDAQKTVAVRREIDKIIERQKFDFDWLYGEIKRRIEAQEKAKSSRGPESRLD